MVTPRAAAPRLLLQQLLIVVVLVALGAVPTRGTAAAKYKPAPSASATDFLRACCAATRNASICYGSLLPRAGYFHGSHVKVARAAAAGAFAQLRSFRRIRSGVGGGLLLGCALDVVTGMQGQHLALGGLHRLERTAPVGPGTERMARQDLFYARKSIGNAGSWAARCARDVVDSGGDASSLIGKQVADWSGSVELYVGIALDLVDSIAL